MVGLLGECWLGGWESPISGVGSESGWATKRVLVGEWVSPGVVLVGMVGTRSSVGSVKAVLVEVWMRYRSTFGGEGGWATRGVLVGRMGELK